MSECRSSCSEVFYKTGVLKNFAKFTEKHMWILRNFLEHLFYITPLGDCFCECIYTGVLCNKLLLLMEIKKIVKK